MKINKRYVVVILIIALIIIGVPKSYANKKLDSIELRENNEINKKAFAMYVENGIGTYDVYSESEYFPNSLKYHYNKDMSKCIDNNEEEIVDNILEYNDSDNSIKVTSNRTVYCYLYFDLDEVKPGTPDAILSNVSNIDNKYTNTRNQTVTVTYSDEDIESYCISLNGTCDEYKTEGLNNVEKTITIKDFDLGDDGNKTVSVWLKDMAGNVSETPKTINIILDTKAPEINNLTVSGVTTYSNVNYVTTASPSVTITWLDSDIDSYCIGSSVCTPSTKYSATNKQVTSSITLSEGANTIHAKVIDKAGNVSVDKTYNLTVDTIKPKVKNVTMGSLATNNTYVTTQKPTITVTFDDADVISYCASLNNTCSTYVNTGLSGKTITLSNYDLGSAEGSKTVNVWLKDKAGNISQTAGSITKTLDLYAPTVSTPTVSGTPTENSIVVSVTVTETGSGIKSVTCSNSGSKPCNCAISSGTNYLCTSTGLTAGTNYTVTVTATDNSGRTGSNTSTNIPTKNNVASNYIPAKNPAGLNKTIQGGMWRFQGTTNVNNYICFGTDNKQTCTGDKDKYMYRIIGIVKDSSDSTLTNYIGSLKIIKNTRLLDNSGGAAYSAFSINDDGKILFSNSLLKQRLNGESTGNKTGQTGNSNFFLGTAQYYNTSYSYLNPTSLDYNKWMNKIVSKQWHEYGSNLKSTSYTAQNIFDDEIKSSISQTSFKIGLMYLSDFSWALSSAGISCWEGDNGNLNTCANAWIHLDIGSDEWSMNIYSYNSYTWVCGIAAWKNYQCIRGGNGAYIRPVFYLTADTVIKSGTGSESDPFIIQV